MATATSTIMSRVLRRSARQAPLKKTDDAYRTTGRLSRNWKTSTSRPNGVANVPEYGTVKKEDEFHALRAMSSYEHVRDGVAYPGVMLVHGGPWVRDAWGFNHLVQFLANRGYAVLQVDYRGSSGYGVEFARKGRGQIGGTMHDDIADADSDLGRFALGEEDVL